MNPAGDEGWMKLALRLARRGEGHVEPNPQVGCVITRDGELLGQGWHQRFGGPHAEIEALANCRESPQGATAWVTLEPCCHEGKTPPCTNALIAAGIARVVVAMVDPFPAVSGKGIEALRAAGMQVDIGTCANDSEQLNAPWLRRIRDGRPWVIAKWAMSLDGRIATSTGESQWISSPGSRAVVHQLRGRMDAIMVGSGTALADDPMLTARPAGPRVATRVVLDSMLRLPLDGKLVRSCRDVPVLVVAGPDAPGPNADRLRDAGCEVIQLAEPGFRDRLASLMKMLAERDMTNVLVEGGGRLLGELFDARLVDEVHVFLSPKIIGGATAVSPVGATGIARIKDSLQLVETGVREVDGDWYIGGRIANQDRR